MGSDLAYGWGMSKDTSTETASLRYDLLAEAMDERRLELGMKWSELAERTGLSEQSLRNIRSGRSTPRELTVRRLEEALGWVRGAVRDTLAGGRPTVSEIPRIDPGSAGELSWRVEGDVVCYELTRMIGDNPFTARLVVRDGRSREQVERELGKVMEMARILLED
jgi:transcriptional regulator with XRE-family HTH domain